MHLWHYLRECIDQVQPVVKITESSSKSSMLIVNNTHLYAGFHEVLEGLLTVNEISRAPCIGRHVGPKERILIHGLKTYYSMEGGVAYAQPRRR
jgi:hypothetical protein